ncbi:peptide ABC transporter substrate-binding protein [Lentilactobacillus sp. IMAU92037]|uniref:peptide ABC transporter substrate-binding protein n=1 Tax=Lentilactobacillus dabitei TaxID=2831523 RepID=UPI001C2C1E4A|nr:peptide ABC transporter substrate-binding protein [Lentilactobacillus dabitei]MBV0929605.1 peptide ABC transporter substrate-binding protein [Lentilactobacillus dabitei]
MRKLLLTLMVGASTVLLAACGSKSSSSKRNSVSLMQTSELLSLDTSEHADFTTWNTLENSMEGLYRANQENEPVPASATSVVKPTDHGLTYTFHLRKNAKWSNGDPLTAQDFVTAWRRSVSPTSKSGYNYIFSGIKNADAITANKKSPKTLGAYALNKHTFQVKLEHPMPYFNKMMVLPAFFPENPTALKKFSSKYGTQSKYMYYNGPFKVTSWNGTNDNWTLKRNKYYYDQKAIHLNELKYSVVKDANTAHELFDQKKLDDATITGVTAKGLQKNKDLIHERKAGTYYLRLNLRKGRPLTNQKMRQALSLVLNRKQLTKDVLADGSEPAYTYTSRDLTKDPTTGKDFATETKPADTYDVAKAKKLWAEGVKESGQKGIVKMDVVGDDQTITKNVAQFVQASVKKSLPGADVAVKSLPTKGQQSAEANRAFDMEQTFWLADFADPISFMGILQSSNPQDYGKYKDSYFDKQYQEASSFHAADPKQYWQNMRNLQEHLNTTMPVVPLYQMVESHLVNPNLKGVLRHPVGEDDYTRAYLSD